MYSIQDSESDRKSLATVSKSEPCQHCQKPDWCYRLGELEVCKRGAIADGWQATSKQDKEGSYYLQKLEAVKAVRPAQVREWIYKDRQGNNLIKIKRTDHGNGKKDVWPYKWLGDDWDRRSGYSKAIKRQDIPVYRHSWVREAIKNGEWIFVVEGEPCADALADLGLMATTSIGGGDTWQNSDTQDLVGCRTIVLCPDRDQPGMTRMETAARSIKKLLPQCQIRWLYAPPGRTWSKLPDKGGLDVADWIADNKLSANDIVAATQEEVIANKQEEREDRPKSKPSKGFDPMLEEIRQCYEFEDPARIEWELQELALRSKRSVAQLKSMHLNALANQPQNKFIDGRELIKQSPDKFDWVIAGLLPVQTTALLYAEGGTGKTLLVNSIIKSITCGQQWNGYPTKKGKVLLLQTDEPSTMTAQSLKIAGFEEDLPEGHLFVNSNWQFTQLKSLKKKIKEVQPTLVVIDSLTSSNRHCLNEEKDVEYGRCLYELRDIALEFGCSFIILHHENKMGGMRGSTSLRDNVSEVWHLKRSNQLSEYHRLLDIEKSRSGCSGVRQLELNIDDYSWQDQGDFDPAQAGKERPATSLPLKARLLDFLNEHPGIPYEPEELLYEFGSNKEAIRKSLERLWRSGLIESELRTKTIKQGKARYRVFFVSELSAAPESTSGASLSCGQSSGQSSGQNTPDLLCPQLNSLPDIAADKTPDTTPKNTTTLNNCHEIYHREHFEVGDKVIWSDAPAHVSTWNPFTITSIDTETAKLDIYEHPVPLNQLKHAER